MPKGKEFSKEENTLLFRVILFVDFEKYDPKIPLYNICDRLQAMLGVSHRTIMKLRQEMCQLAFQQVTMDIEQKENEEEQQLEARSRRQSTSIVADTQVNQNIPINVSKKGRRRSAASSITTIGNAVRIPSPISLKKQRNSGREKIVLTEHAEDQIRYQFHSLLASKKYPTTSKLLTRLLEDVPNFPIESETTLRRFMHRLSFKYKKSSKRSFTLDTTSFVTSRAKYFRHLNDLRINDVAVYYHDEKWANSNEDQRYIWIDERGKGRLRKTEGKDELDFS
ncbi:unnamed protein product [Rotaria sordida]|uniref:Uncharacterized protein n=1 Tax=Rotaria sordida TaxID=392033 RepID=A0A819N9V3_9BILA|nr:unnamed protein product [Rotaria sordida]CAF3992555.1 unnamed protein product [Rotaria sordida]